MAKLSLIIFVVLILSIKIDNKFHIIHNLYQAEEQPTLQDQLSPLLEAIIQVETRGKNISGDGGAAAGILQIHKIQVDETNRVAKLMGKEERFSYEDRWDQQKSKDMFFIIVEYWHNDIDNWEEIARCWNGGPKGMDNPKTKKYWKKVEFELEVQKQLASN